MFSRLCLALLFLAVCAWLAPLGAQAQAVARRVGPSTPGGQQRGAEPEHDAIEPVAAESSTAPSDGQEFEQGLFEDSFAEEQAQRDGDSEGSHWGPLACRLVVRQTVAPPQQQPAVLTCVALNIDGTLAATGGDDHHVRLWRTADGRLLAVLKGHQDWVRACLFEPDGTGLLTCGDDRLLLRWDLQHLGERRLVARHAAAAFAMALLTDQRQVAAAGFEPRVWLHPLAPSEASAPLAAPCPDMRGLAASPDGNLLAAAGRCGTVRVWRTDTWEVVWNLKEAGGRIRSLAFSPQGTFLAAGGEGEHILVWEADSGVLAQTLPARPGKALALVFCDEQTLAVGSSQNDIRLWNVEAAELVQRLEGHTGSVAGLAWHGGSGMLASVSFDTTLRLWQREGARPQVARTPAAAGR